MRNIIKKALLFFALALGFASLASAQALSNVYLGAGLGASNIKLDSSDFAGLTSKDERDTGSKLFGGYRFNQWLSGELAYTDLGKANFSFPGGNGSANATAWSLAAVGTWPLAGGFSLLGKVGASFNKAKTDLTCAGCSNADKSKTDVLWGIGAGYDFSPRLGLRLEYEDYGKFGEQLQTAGSQTGRYKPTLVSGSVVFRF